MFWNDICEIKKSIDTMDQRICRIFCSVEKMINYLEKPSSMPLRCDGDRIMDAGIEDIKELLCDVFSSEDENNTINRLHDKIDMLVRDDERAQSVIIAQKTLDKFEDYMKNVDKFNAMINEFKGCVSMARASIAEGNILTKHIDEMKKLSLISHEIHKSMLAFIRAGDKLESKAHFKLDAIYKTICEKGEKAEKVRKSVKKKVSPSP